MGTLIGVGAGFTLDTALCGWSYGACGFTMGGVGAGALAGVLVLARPKPALRAQPSSGQPDVVSVERVVRALGVDERIVVTDANAREIRGSIQTIGQDRFVVVPDEQAAPVEIAFSEVQTLRKKPLDRKIKLALLSSAASSLWAPQVRLLIGSARLQADRPDPLRQGSGVIRNSRTEMVLPKHGPTEGADSIPIVARAVEPHIAVDDDAHAVEPESPTRCRASRSS